MAKKSRIKLVVPTIETREEMRVLAGEIVRLNAEREVLTATLNAEIAKVQARHAAKQAELDAAIDLKMRTAKQWADANAKEFGDLRSITFTEAIVGFRLGNWKVETIGKMTWRQVEELLEKRRSRFLDWKPVIDKAAIIKLRDRIGEKRLAALGMEVVREDSFYIVDPAKKTVDQPLKEAA